MRRPAWLAIALLALAAWTLPAWAKDSPPSAIPEIAVERLPAEAQATLALIRKGGPFPYRKDGSVFGNREGRLPRHDRGYWREYTVKTPGARDRGARRIVAGKRGEAYYTEDHYNSFRRIRE